jgi:hypothetical protein
MIPEEGRSGVGMEGGVADLPLARCCLGGALETTCGLDLLRPCCLY